MNNNLITGTTVVLIVITLFTKMGRYALGAGIMLAIGSAYQASKITLRVTFGGLKGAYRSAFGLPMADPIATPRGKEEAPSQMQIIHTVVSVEPAVIVRQPIGTKASVVFWFYEDKVKRSIFMYASSLLKKHGYCVNLTELSTNGISRDDVISQTMTEARAWFSSATAPAPAVNVTSIAEAIAAKPVPVTVSPQEYSIQKKEFIEQASWVGILQSSGYESRMMGDKPTNQFCVRINDKKLGGALNQIWGTDLERALRDSGAQLGETVKVSLLGDTKVAGQNNRKKIYHIEVI